MHPPTYKNWSPRQKRKIFHKVQWRMCPEGWYFQQHNDVIKWKHFPRYWPFVNSLVPGEFPAQRPVTRRFDVFFDLRLNKRLSKQSQGWWFETQSRSLWRHRNEHALVVYVPLAWNCLRKEMRLCDEIEAFKRNLKRPRMLSAQFVPLYKPCKSKPKVWYVYLWNTPYLFALYILYASHWLLFLVTNTTWNKA